MEEIVLFEESGNIKFAYKRDGSNSSFSHTNLFSAAQNFFTLSKDPFVLSSQGGKKIAFLQESDGSLLCYVTSCEYPDLAIIRALTSQSLMYSAFFGSFLRPIHVDGIHLQTIFQRPRVHPHVHEKRVEKLLQDLTAACSTPLVAVYWSEMIFEATDDYWHMSMMDIFAIDLLVRNNDAPFTDQMFRREDGAISRVCVCLLQDSLRFVAVGNVNLSQVAVTKLPQAFYANEGCMKYMKSFVDFSGKELNVIGWIIKDRESPRFFGYYPPNMEKDFISLACKAEEIIEKNRVSSVSLRLNDYKFFYFPKFLVRDTSFFKELSHVWDFYCIHDLPNETDITEFGKEALKNFVQFLKPVLINRGRIC